MAWIERLLPGLAASPDVHPMLVHFPAALFPVALLFALLAAWRYRSLTGPARLLIWSGTISMVAAAATGLWAQRLMPHGPGSPVVVHRTFMLVGGAAALLLSLFAFARRLDDSRRSMILLSGGLFLLNGVLVLGADRGALVALKFRSSLAVELPAAGEPVIPTEGSAIEGEDPSRGRILYDKLGCETCHGPERKMEGPGIPPALDLAGSKMQQGWIREYLLHPHRIRWVDAKMRPVLRMPDFQLSPAEASDLAAYLEASKDSSRFPEKPVVDPPLSQKDAEEGRSLVRQYACLGCHTLRGSGSLLGPALDSVGRRLTPAYLYAFLMAPKQVISGTPMKDFGLWEEEGRSITAYMMTLRGRGADSISTGKAP